MTEFKIIQDMIGVNSEQLEKSIKESVPNDVQIEFINKLRDLDDKLTSLKEVMDSE